MTATQTKPKPRLDKRQAEIEKLKKQLLAGQQKLAAGEKKLGGHLQIKERYVSTHLWEYFKPYLWQARCTDLIKEKLITLAPSPNKIGKCLTYETLISTPFEGEVSIGSLFEKGRPFDVYAWDEKRRERVVARAKAPFKKDGSHQCYRITMSDGRIIEAADHHRILTDAGWISTKDLHRTFSDSLQVSNLEPCLSTRALDVNRLNQKRLDCRDDYSKGRRLSGGQPLLGGDIGLVFFPLQGDVLKHIWLLSNKDGWGSRYIHNPLLSYDPLSMIGVLFHALNQHFESLFQSVCRGVLRFLSLFQISPQLSSVEDIASPPFVESDFQVQDTLVDNAQDCLSSQSPKKINPIYPNTNRIVSIVPIGVKDVYDFTVEKYHNYLAGGLIHHNTALVACVVMSWLRGYEAWSPVDADYPGAVKHDGKWYKPSSLEIKPPVRIRITGEDWRTHLGETVVPELKKWFPMEDFHVKNHETGTACLFTDKKTGSTLALLTHTMEDDKYESWLGDGWIPDEPPPENKYKGMQRGLFGKRGKTFIPTTPLKEAWILDELVLKNRSDVGVMKDLCCLDNETYFGDDDKILTEMGLSGKRTKYWREMEGQKKTFFDLIMRRDLYVDFGDDGASDGPPEDQGASAEKFLRENTPEETHDRIMDLKFLKFAKDTSDEDKPSRFFGLFKKLVGLVIKEFDKSKHYIRAEGKIPTNWIVTPMIDFHLGMPHAISFYACDERNIHLVIDEVWENMTSEDIADLIIRKKKVDCWRIDEVFIDPLSKGDEKYMKNRDPDAVDSFTIIEERLAAEDITLEVASKDKKSGFTNIKAWLKSRNRRPILFFLDSLQSIKKDMYGHIYEIQRLCYVKGEIEKENDHFMENLYRYTLTGVKYSEPRKPHRVAVGSGTEGGWLGT